MKFRRFALYLAASATALLVGGTGATQEAPKPPAGAQAGGFERQLERFPEPQFPSQPLELPVSSSEQAAPPNAASVRFLLRRIAVEGNTQFASTALVAPHESLYETIVSLADIYRVAREMTAVYRNAGFILANVIVPAQKVSDGNLRLQVVEGFVSAIKVDGGALRNSLVESARARVLAEKPLRASTLERFVLLLNDLPGVTAQAILAPAANVPGAAELTVKLAQERFSAEVGASYRGSELQGPGRIETGLTFNSVLGLNESTSLRYLQAPKAEELRLFQLGHVQRLTGSGLDLSVSGSKSEGAPRLSGDLSAFNLETDTTQARIELSHPFRRSRTQNLRGRLALTYHDGRTDIIGLPLYEDRLSAARVGVTWDLVDSLGGVNIVDLEYSKGLSLFGASEIDSPTASRPGGDPRFSKATWYVARLQSVARGFSVLFAVTGQAAFTNLLSPEEFAFGGEQFGRGYDPSEIVGDEGIMGKVELRYTRESANGLGFTVYGFGESGRVKRELDADEIGEPTEDGASDLGVGLRFTFRNWLTGYVEAAEPTDQPIASTGKKEARVFGGVVVTYRF